MRIEGDFREALGALKEIQWQFRRGIMQKALNVAARPIVKAAQVNARKIPKDSGVLARGVATRSSKGRKVSHRAWVGIGMKNESVVVDRTGWRGKTYQGVLNPSRYAHLKEYGGNFGRFAKKTRQPAHPLFEAAVRDGQAQFAQAFVEQLRKGVADAFLKGRSKAAALGGGLRKP